MIESIFTWLGVEATPFLIELTVISLLILLCFGLMLLFNCMFDAVISIFRGRR